MNRRRRKIRVFYDQAIFKAYRLFVLPGVRLEHKGRVLFLDMVVDMGATDVVIDPAAFEALGISPAERVSAISASRRHRTVRGRIERVAIAPFVVAENVTILAMDLPSGLIGEGLLGASFLAHFPFFVDYDRGILEFHV